MTWMTPFDCTTLAIVTLAIRSFSSLRKMVPSFMEAHSLAPLDLVHAAIVPNHLGDGVAQRLHGHDVVGQDLRELSLVLDPGTSWPFAAITRLGRY
jgi:hypothetical protein